MRAAFQQRPEVLDSVGMHLAVDVFSNMVDHFMHEVLFQSVVANPLVGIDLRVAAYFAEDFTLQGIAAHVGDNLRPDFARRGQAFP